MTSISDPSLTLVIALSFTLFNITEPDEGETVGIEVCFEASVDLPRRTDAIFALLISNSTTANVADFSIQPSLIIPTGFGGFYNQCVEIDIFGDNRFESSELIVVEVRPLAEGDRVQFPEESSESLQVNIIDNDGKK